jgi:hypothetical protein
VEELCGDDAVEDVARDILKYISDAIVFPEWIARAGIVGWWE